MATNFTLVPTVLPFGGLEIVTPAKADVAAKTTTTVAVEIRACFFILAIFSGWGFGSGTGKAIQLRGIHRCGRNTLDRAKPPTRPEEDKGRKRIYERRASLYTGFY